MPDAERPPPRSTLAGPFAPNPAAPYVELGLASAFSFLRGASDATEFAATASLAGHDALGIADLNSFAGIVRFHLAAETTKIRPVIGCRLALVTGETFLAYPRDRAAYGRLCRLLSKGKMADAAGNWQAKGACDITLADLAAHGEGTILILVPDGRSETRLARLTRRLPGLDHLAASYLYRGDDIARIDRLDALARANGLALLATNDVHYHAPRPPPAAGRDDRIRHKTTVAAAGYLLHANAERHLKSPAEMCRLFARWPHAIAAAREVADACRFSLDELRYEYPQELPPRQDARRPHLEELTWEGAATRYPDGVPDRIAANAGEGTGADREEGAARAISSPSRTSSISRGVDPPILCQGRGSAANSAVCYCLEITAVDPAKHDAAVRPLHLRGAQGAARYRRRFRARAARGGDPAHLREIRPPPRRAVRHGDPLPPAHGDPRGRQGDGPVRGRDRRARPHRLGQLRQARSARSTPPRPGMDLTDPHLRRVLKLTEQMIGMPRHLSQHVGGFILTEGPLTETVPIGNGAMPERSFIEWDKDDIDALGILKVDVLALGMLTCIRKCLDLLAAHHGRA